MTGNEPPSLAAMAVKMRKEEKTGNGIRVTEWKQETEKCSVFSVQVSASGIEYAVVVPRVSW